ncbi:hypothetical protein [Amycolatopsis sp. CA-128772]|uniref:hypothetical protein n=1 Tax=Amycolatopsis sp. CA-128772 TaxID=2073159 RepID=UPI0011AFD5AE|nr:hypothetical protein [Amycolatopsis sp. CA-128772]
MAAGAVTIGIDGGRLDRRVARSAEAVDALGGRIRDWLGATAADPVFHRFGSHLRTLDAVLTGMLDRLRAELAAVPAETAAGYEHCRGVDRGLATLQQLFRWYAGKYDQRRAAGHPAVLAAADEFARSCWSEGFAARGRKPPTGPLCFVDNRTDALARRRCDVPAELRPALDDPVAEFVDRLPIPVIALPEPAVREGWWLVLAAHETGHHVLLDLELGAAVRQALRDAVPPDLVADWTRWHHEVFADLYSVLMAGPAAAWAIDELQYGPPAHLLRPRGGYPAPLVRLALLGETLEALGAASDVPTAAGAAAAADAAAEPHLAALPAIVAALLDIPLGRGTLRNLALDEVIRPGPRLQSWAGQLTRPEPAIGAVDTPEAPRILAAAAVHRYRALTTAGRDDELAALHSGLLSVLARSGAPGVLAPPGETQLDQLAGALGELLVGRAADDEHA